MFLCQMIFQLLAIRMVNPEIVHNEHAFFYSLFVQLETFYEWLSHIKRNLNFMNEVLLKRLHFIMVVNSFSRNKLSSRTNSLHL